MYRVWYKHNGAVSSTNVHVPSKAEAETQIKKLLPGAKIGLTMQVEELKRA